MNNEDSDRGQRPRRTKVERLIDEFHLEDIGDELEYRWTREAEKRDGLRVLADIFNKNIVEKTLIAADWDPIDGEVDNIYRVLTDEEVSRGVITEVEKKLNREDIDADKLQDSFVTYQAVRTYLKEVRGASYSENSGDIIKRAQSSFERLIGRTSSVVEQKVNQLESSGKLTLGTFRVRASVTIFCEDCESQYHVVDILKRGGCDCMDSQP